MSFFLSCISVPGLINGLTSIACWTLAFGVLNIERMHCARVIFNFAAPARVGDAEGLQARKWGGTAAVAAQGCQVGAAPALETSILSLTYSAGLTLWKDLLISVDDYSMLPVWIIMMIGIPAHREPWCSVLAMQVQVPWEFVILSLGSQLFHSVFVCRNCMCKPDGMMQ